MLEEDIAVHCALSLCRIMATKLIICHNFYQREKWERGKIRRKTSQKWRKMISLNKETDTKISETVFDFVVVVTQCATNCHIIRLQQVTTFSIAKHFKGFLRILTINHPVSPLSPPLLIYFILKDFNTIMIRENSVRAFCRNVFCFALLMTFPSRDLFVR